LATTILRTLREGLPDRDQVFEHLYSQHADRVRGILFRIAHPNDLEDLQQETFVRVWKGLNLFRRHSNVKTWIYRIAVNTALDHLRLKARRPKEVEATSSVESVDLKTPEDALVHKRRVQEVLLSLEDDLRAVLVLHLFENFKMNEIAKILSIPTGTVKSRLHRAREEARKYLESQGVKL